LEVSRPALFERVHTGRWAAAIANPAGGGAADFEAHASDDALCARWLENPYYQFFCGELSFCHRLRFDRSSLTHWRQRLVEDKLPALIQESLAVAHKSGAPASRDLERVVVDTTVQPKVIAHPTDERLCHRALERLVDLTRPSAGVDTDAPDYHVDKQFLAWRNSAVRSPGGSGAGNPGTTQKPHNRFSGL
jgi:hypothetical protein